MKRFAVVLLVTILLKGCATAARGSRGTTEQFQLFMNCEPMNLSVQVESEMTDITHLTEGSVRLAAQSRLLQALLYDESEPQFLGVLVHVARGAFGVEVTFNKPVRDPVTDRSLPAATWRSLDTGIHRMDGNYVVSAVGQTVDNFLREYRRVNARACSR